VGEKRLHRYLPHRAVSLIDVRFLPSLGYAMAVALETFVKQLTDSGIIAPGKLADFVPPKAAPKDAQELALQLVKS
jgi:hypothetical protein